MNDSPIERGLRTDFYPEMLPYDQGTLVLDAVHTMYYEQSGNPDGVPVLFLHGGPGSGASAVHRQFFDPNFYRIVIFDQRGAGRSTPVGELRDNTTPHLIADIECLRTLLNIERWAVFGGSWGSTLALAYAQHHPSHVSALVIRGVFLCRESEIDWFLFGMKHIYPEPWRQFVSILDAADRASYKTVLQAYFAKLTHEDAAVRMPAARVWSSYEGSCSALIPSASLVAGFASDRVASGLARIEAHYMMNEIFLPTNFILDNLNKIRHIPCTIVQGRYDVVCPIISADDLSQAWPEAEYHIINDAGHSAFEPGTRARLIATMEKLKARLGG